MGFLYTNYVPVLRTQVDDVGLSKGTSVAINLVHAELHGIVGVRGFGHLVGRGGEGVLCFGRG